MNILLAIPAYIWLIASAMCFAAGEYFSKKWGMHPSWGFAFVVLIPYMFGTFAWLPALLHKNSLSIMGDGLDVTLSYGDFGNRVYCIS